MKIAVLFGREGKLGRATLTDIFRAWGHAGGHAVDISLSDDDVVAQAVDGILATADGAVIELSRPAVRAVASLPAERSRRVVFADIDQSIRAEGRDPASDVRVIWGRGIETFRWAASALVNSLRSPAIRHSYGDHADQFAELRTPATAGPHPVVVLFHGGFWRAHWELDLMDDLAIDLTGRGYATWNLEYRRGPGSAQAAIDDVHTGLDRLAALDDRMFDLERVAVVGHSAGGHLAMLAAGRSSGRVTPAVCIGLAPVADLAACAARGLGDGAAIEFMGGESASMPTEYRDADPSTVPDRRADRIAVVQGLADSFDLIDLSRRYAEANPAAELIEVPGADHFHVIDPTADAWLQAEAAIARRM